MVYIIDAASSRWFSLYIIGVDTLVIYKIPLNVGEKLYLVHLFLEMFLVS